MRTNPWGGVFLVVCLLLCAGRDSAAQDVPFDPAVDVQLFEYAIGPKSFLTVADADVQDKDAFNLDFLVTFLTDPFTIYNTDVNGTDLDNRRTEVVQSILAGELSGAYGLLPKLQLGMSLPLVFSMSGQGLDPTTAMAPVGDNLQISGLGDARFEAKYRLLEKGALAVAASGGVSIPTSFGAGGNDFLGDDLPTFRAALAGQWTNRDGNLSFGANAGVLFRKPRTIYSSEIGQQLTYGAAASYQFTDRFSAVAEIFGRGALTNLDLSASPLEAGGGARAKITNSLTVLVGGGAGIVRGIGSPGLRMFVSVGWSPDYRDDDGDGVRNDRDQCPLEAEDHDQFEDDDGCPDLDNDNDKRPDTEDKCPLEREDIDGFEDDDGCPELDNDKDNIPDIDDRCPNAAEDGAKPYPKDGCPGSARDSDDDGIPDGTDQCPMDPEDADNFEDWDGCPDGDNDKDGIPDEDDKCPACAEDKDGDADADGCPDVGPNVDPRIAHLEDDRLVLGADITFASRGALTAMGGKLVTAAAGVMSTTRGVSKWTVVVAVAKGRSERRAKIKAARRAKSVTAQLVANGVDRKKLTVLPAAAAIDAVRIIARDREAVEDEGFSCPAQFMAKPRAQSATPAPASPAPASPATPAPASPAPNSSATVVPDAFTQYSGVVSVHFKRSRAKLAGGKNVLKKVAALLVANPGIIVVIGTHTDSRKGVRKSKSITQKQAEVARAYLLANGVAERQVQAVGYGMDEPRASNKTSKGRDQNRRVEFQFSIK